MIIRGFSVVALVLLLASMLTLAFNIQPAGVRGTIYIRADGSIDPLAVPMQSNVLSASSVPPQTEWNKTYGGTYMDAGQRGIQTSDGGYAIVGDTDSYGAGGTDFWLVKTDVDGNMQWSRTYGGTDTDEAYALVQTGDGGYALAGYTQSFGAGMSDFWLVKTDASGNAQWNKTYGGTKYDEAYALVQTGDGGYTLAGATLSYGAGGADFWLIKTDASGNAQWNKTYGGTGLDTAYWVAQTNEGGYILMANTKSFGAGGYDFWLVKTDSAGNTQWNKTYGGAGTDISTFIIQTSDGGYTFVGYTNSFGVGGFDSWLIRTDSAGNVQWNKTYGGAADDYLWSVIQTSEGGYALSGVTDSSGAGGYDSWLVKTDSAGNTQWSKTYGGAGDDYGGSHVQTSDGGYALIGSTNSFGAGDYDFWLIKTTPAVLSPIAYIYSGWGMNTMLDEMSYLNSLDPSKYSFEFFNEVNINDLWPTLPDYRALLIDEDTFYSDSGWTEYGGPIYGNFTQHSNELASWVIDGGGIFASGENDLLRSQTWDWLPPGMRVTSYDPESTSSVHVVSDPGLYSEPNVITNAYLSGGHTHAYFTSWDQGYLTTVRRNDNNESIELFGIFGRNGGVIVVSHIEAEAMLNAWEYMQNQLDYASPAYPPWVLTITQPSEGSKLEVGNPVTITATIIDGDTGNPGTGATVTANAPNGTLLTLTETSPGIYVTTYTVKETDPKGNWTINAVGIIGGKFPKDSVTVKVALHNVAITKVQPSKTVVGHGYDTGINVTVANQGSWTEAFNATLYVENQITINQTGLVGYWKFDEGSGTIASDSSGNNNHGTISGAVWTGGRIGSALQFDGIDDYVQVPDSAGLNITNDEISIAAWVKMLGDGTNNGVIVCKQAPAGASDASYSLDVYPSIHVPVGRHVEFAVNVGGSWTPFVSTSALNLSTWNHIVGTYDGSKVRIFINGVLDTECTLAGNIVPKNGPLYIGHEDAWSPGEYFNGTIDEVKVYNRTLSADEIWNEYERGLGPVGYWKFDEGLGTVTQDSSGNGYSGTIYDAAWIDGHFGKALRFDGSDYVDIQNSATLNFDSSKFTLEAWVRFTNNNGDNVIIGKHQSGYSNGYFLGIRGNKFNFLLGNNQSLDRLETSETYNDGQWHHIVGVYDRPTQYLYVDGVLKAQRDINYSIFNSLDVNMGRVFNTGYLNGDVDEVKIYSKALSADEIRQEYEAGLGSLVGYWKFDEGSGTTAYDSSGNGNNGTLVNGPTWVDGRFGKALSFDGIDDYLDAGNGASLQFGNNFTLEAWIKPNNMVGETLLITKYPDGGGFYFETNPGASLLLAYHDGTTYVYAGGSVSSMILNRWNHIAVTMNDTETSYYINGMLAGTANNVQMTPNTLNNVRISSTGFPFNGTIDEVKIFNRALSAEEIWTEHARAPFFAIGTQTVTLESGASKTLTFKWNTTGFAYGNYSVSAYASPVEGETYATDNTLVEGWIFVTIPGDVNGDKRVNILDCILVGVHKGHVNGDGHTPGSKEWFDCANCDINSDAKTNVLDCIILSNHFGQSWT